MGASVSSNYAEQAQSASQSFSTKVGQAMKTNQSSVNSAVQECKNMTIEAKKNSDVKACNMIAEQGISATQVNEAFQKASIENQSYSAMQQKMSQAAKALVKGFNFGAYSAASNTVKQSMQASVTVNNEVKQECGSGNAGVNKILQDCSGTKIKAKDGSTVKFCNQTSAQKQLINQISKCRQDTVVNNKAVQNMMQTAKQTAVASSIGIDPVLLGIVLIVAMAIGGVFFVKRATDPKFVRIFAAIASVCGGIALVVIAMLNANKPGFGQDQMLATAYPGDAKFINPGKFTEDQIANLKAQCNPEVDGGKKLTRDECNHGPNSDVCQYNIDKGCQLKTSTLVGYPYVLQGSQEEGVLPANVNDACMADPKCSGWRWDATDAEQAGKGLEYVEPMKKNEVDNDAPHGALVKAAQWAFTGTDKNKKFSREDCYNNKPYCSDGCISTDNVKLFPDVRDACGINNGKFVGKDECNKRPAFTTKDGGVVKGCTWQNSTGQCMNNAATENTWNTKAYSCVKCRDKPATGVGILYTLTKDGLPPIAKHTWTANAWKRYATGEGGLTASVNPDESASLQCANFPRFGAVRMPPSGRAPTKECADSNAWGCTVPSKGFNDGMKYGGIGLIGLGVVLFVIQVIAGRKGASGKV